jgi:hypothetical protein
MWGTCFSLFLYIFNFFFIIFHLQKSSDAWVRSPRDSTKTDGGFICDMLGISTSEVQRIGAGGGIGELKGRKLDIWKDF